MYCYLAFKHGSKRVGRRVFALESATVNAAEISDILQSTISEPSDVRCFFLRDTGGIAISCKPTRKEREREVHSVPEKRWRSNRKEGSYHVIQTDTPKSSSHGKILKVTGQNMSSPWSHAELRLLSTKYVCRYIYLLYRFAVDVSNER
jgi:hypothetical protein